MHYNIVLSYLQYCTQLLILYSVTFHIVLGEATSHAEWYAAQAVASDYQQQ